MPLHLAAETTPLGDAAEDARQADVIRLLAEHGAELNAQDKKGRTPLHRATYEGQVDAVEALLAAGADPSIPNKSGKNAFAIARKAAKHYKAAEPRRPLSGFFSCEGQAPRAPRLRAFFSCEGQAPRAPRLRAQSWCKEAATFRRTA